MFGNTPTNGLTIGRIISGISKSLNVVNQLIPLYREVKPVIGNAKTILGTIKELGTSSKEKKSFINKPKIKEKDISLSENISNNNPVFFN